MTAATPTKAMAPKLRRLELAAPVKAGADGKSEAVEVPVVREVLVAMEGVGKGAVPLLALEV